MKLYLINKNPIISKLVALSVSKLGVEMEESPEIDLTRNLTQGFYKVRRQKRLLNILIKAL